MTTLKELGISIIGNYISGERSGVVLNQEGAKFFSDLFNDQQIHRGDDVTVKPKKPRGDYGQGAVGVEVNGFFRYPCIVFLNKDNFFDRQS